jgi:outer membrane protein assembly factor BamE
MGALASGCVYRINIQQGNFLDQAAVDQVKPGMTRSQIRYLLGTPMVADPFVKDRWDYIYYLKKGRSRHVDSRRVTVYFDGDKVAKLDKPTRGSNGADPTSQSGVAFCLLGARASGGFGIGGEGAVNFDAVTRFQRFIGAGPPAEDAYCSIRPIHAGEIGVERGQAQRIRNPGAGVQAKGFDDDAVGLCIGNLDLQRCGVHFPGPSTATSWDTLSVHAARRHRRWSRRGIRTRH